MSLLTFDLFVVFFKSLNHRFEFKVGKTFFTILAIISSIPVAVFNVHSFGMDVCCVEIQFNDWKVMNYMINIGIIFG